MTDSARRVVVSGVVLVVSLVVIGWVLLRDDAPVVEPTSTPTVAVPTPTPSATPTPTPSDTPTPTPTPTPDFTPTELPTGEDLRRVVEIMLDIRHEAILRRDVSLLGRIYLGQCDCLVSDRRGIDELIDAGEFVRGRDPTIETFEVTERSDRDAAVITVDISFAPTERLNSADEIVSTSESFQRRFEIGLLRGFGALPDEQWGVAVFHPVTVESPS